MTDTPANSPATTPAKKRSLGKLIVRLFFAFILLIIVALVVLYFSKDILVRSGVVYGGEYATEQKTALEQANLSLFGGAVKLSALDIANLKDFKESKLLIMKSCDTTIDPNSIFTNTIVVREIAIDGLELTLEQNGSRNNLNELMEILKKKSPAAGGSTANDAKGRQLKIQKIHLTGTKVHIRSAGFNMNLDLGPIELLEPTNPDGRDMKIADVIARILLNVSKQALEDPRFPADLRANMKNVTATIDSVKGLLDKGLTDFKKDFSKDPMKAVQDLGKNGQDISKNLQNLFNNQPKTQPKTQPK